jgi:two-component system phosphate regulon sensor histidine kinase PhoR
VTEQKRATADQFWQEVRLIDGPFRWFYWLIGLLGVWLYQRGDLSANVASGLLLYGALNVALIPLLPRTRLRYRPYLIIALYAIDLIYVSFLILHTGGLVSQFYLLYCLLIFKAAIYYPYVHPIIFVPFLIFPLYIFTLYLSSGTLVFLQDQLFQSRYALLFLVILAGLYTAWHLDSRHRQTDERRREIRAVLDGIGDGVIVVDRALRLAMINPVAADIFNMAYPQPPGARVEDMVDNPALVAMLRQALDDAGNSDTLVSGEIKASPISSGKTIVCQALATALASEEDEPHGAVVVLRDMTRQKELEESKSNFISMLSHELRTPLTAVRGFVDLILSGSTGEISEKQREYLDIVFDQSEQLQNLIEALLEFAELEASETSLELEPISLEALIHDVLDRVESLARHREVTLRAELPSDLAPFYADERRLERVLLNLLDNAVKFSPEKGLVTLTVSEQETGVKVCVTDTGKGVPLAERKRVFERFYQIDSSTTRAHGGAGMGLALSKHIVELHRGEIWVEEPDHSTAGNGDPGSRFCFIIPRDLAQQIALSDEPISATREQGA